MDGSGSKLILLGAGAWFIFLNKPAGQPIITAKEKQPVKDLPPGRNAATLTLADGKTIVLDSSSGTITQQGGVTVINMSGMLSYVTAEASAKAGLTTDASKPIYNTVTTARGNQYQLILADGSKIWLNSTSSLRFPTAFTGAHREVELDGEGYFEVAQKPEQPFIVHFNNSRVEVLGTHFNVNCYNDEETAKTTLVEGKIKIENTILKPGEQAVLTPNAPISINHNVDIQQVMAWKNGWFEFDNTDLKTILRQISRWYDVDIIYQHSPPANAKFGGRISRNANLSEILKGLECEELQFKLEGNNRYWKALYISAHNILQVKEAAQDAVQDVFISLWKRRNDVHIKSLRPYLFQAIRFQIFKAIRAEKTDHDFFSRLALISKDILTEEPLLFKELESLYTQLIRSLPADEQEIFSLHRDGGLTYKQIAGRKKISVKTVEKKMTRALKQLRYGMNNFLSLF